jgi:cytosine/adenosine deaminase-related metal-dependent hydrolase
MYEIGALGENVVLNHMTALDDFEVDLVLETGTMICHNPSSALKLSKGVTQTGRFPELIQRGATIGLGTDGSNASNHSDIFRAMSLAVLLPRDARIDPTVTVAEDGLDMAIRGGARVSGWGDRIGSLEPGRAADLIVVDTDRPDMRPSVSIVHDLVYAANGGCVRHTIIDGRIVMEDRVLLTIDEPTVLAQATTRAHALLDRIGHVVTSRWPIVH